MSIYMRSTLKLLRGTALKAEVSVASQIWIMLRSANETLRSHHCTFGTPFNRYSSRAYEYDGFFRQEAIQSQIPILEYGEAAQSGECDGRAPRCVRRGMSWPSDMATSFAADWRKGLKYHEKIKATLRIVYCYSPKPINLINITSEPSVTQDEAIAAYIYTVWHGQLFTSYSCKCKLQGKTVRYTTGDESD